MVTGKNSIMRFPQNLNAQSLQSYVDGLVDQYGVPALSLAIWHNNTLHSAAAGILNVETGVEANTDSVFQIGSVTKVVTATIIMQLVDAGRVDLDRPVKHYLRDFQVADPCVTKTLTVRQLLNHTNGLAGDFIVDDPITGGNPIAAYVERCGLLPQVHPLGEFHSYSNSAYAIAGRLIEVVLGCSWFDAVEENVIHVLGLSRSFAKPADALRFRSAMGHMPAPESPASWQLASSCYPPLGLAAAGTTLSMSASDMVAFVRAHLPQESSESVGRPGKRWLSNSSIKQMQTSSVKLPENSPGSVTDWGLGWCLMDGGRNPIVGHDGATFGQCCLVNMLPEQGLIFSVQTNCTQGSVLKTVFNDVMATLANIRFTPAEPSESLLNPDSVVGTYDSFDAIITVSLNGSELIAIRKDKVLGLPDETWNLKSIDENAMAVYSKNGERIDNIVFLDRNAKGQAGYLYASFCVYRRVSI